MSRLEHPRIRLKIEVDIPDSIFASVRKFSVSRTFKAKWSNNPDIITSEILNEIKKYKGSFIGDTIESLHNLVKTEEQIDNDDRQLEIVKWSSTLLDTLLFSSIKEGLHKDLFYNKEIVERDGTFKSIDPVSSEELKEANIEKIMILLAPKIKHFLFLMSKDIKSKG